MSCWRPPTCSGRLARGAGRRTGRGDYLLCDRLEASINTVTITFDYMCPFARIANEAAIELEREDPSATFVFAPFSLHQNALDDDGVAIWDTPNGIDGRGVRALLWAIAVRDDFPDRFRDFHIAVFSARHDDGADINDADVLAGLARTAGVDAGAVADAVASGTPMKTLQAEHGALVEDHGVFGVPTFISGGEAVFVRLMERHQPDDVRSVLDMLQWTDLNEFKRTRVAR